MNINVPATDERAIEVLASEAGFEVLVDSVEGQHHCCPEPSEPNGSTKPPVIVKIVTPRWLDAGHGAQIAIDTTLVSPLQRRFLTRFLLGRHCFSYENTIFDSNGGYGLITKQR